MGLLKPANVLIQSLSLEQKQKIKDFCGIGDNERVITFNDGYNYISRSLRQPLDLYSVLDCYENFDVLFYTQCQGFAKDGKLPQEIVDSVRDFEIPIKNVRFLSEYHLDSQKEKQDNPKPRIILVDAIGILSHLYSISKVGIVNKNHNILEPVIAGARSIFDAEWGKDWQCQHKSSSYNERYGPF